MSLVRLRQLLVRIAVTGAGLIVIGLAVIQMAPVRLRVLEFAQDRAARDFGVRLRASRLDYSLLARSIELHDVSVSAVAADTPFLQAERAVLILGPGILWGRASVAGVSLSQPRLTVVRNADGSTNLPVSTTSSPAASPVHLGVVSITGGSMQLEDRASRRSVTLGPIDVSVNTGGTQTQPGTLAASPFTIRTGDVGISGTIAGRVSFDGTRVRVEQLVAEAREGRIVVDGWADLVGAQPAISSQVKATINLAQAAGVAGVDARGLAGRIDTDINVTGTLDAPAVALRIASRDASYAPIGRVRLTGRSSLGAGRALIETLDIESAKGSLHADGTIGTASRLAVRWANLQLDDLVRTFGRPVPVRFGSVASGSAAIEFAAHDLAARAWSRLRANATTTLRSASTASDAAALGLSGVLDLHLDQGRWSAHHSLRLASARAELAGDLTGRMLDADILRSTLAGRSRVRVDDIGTLPTCIGAMGVRLPPAATEGLTGSMRATIDLAGLIENPTARIDVGIQDVRTPLLSHPAAIEASLSVDTNGVTAQHVRAAAGTSTLKGSGRYLWRGPLQASAEVDQGDLSEVAGEFASPVSVSGSARLTGTLTGTPRSVQAQLSLSARDLAVDQVAIGPLTAAGTLNLADGGAMKLEATAPGLGARANLEILNRTGYPLSGEITVEHQNIGEIVPARYRSEIGDLSGRLRAVAHGSGLLSDPAGIRGRIEIGALDATWRGTRLTLASAGTVIVGNDRIAANAFDLRVGQHSRIALAGQLGVSALPEPFRLHLDGPLSELIDIGSRMTGAPPVNVRGEGRAAFDVTVGGTLGHPQPAGTLTVRSPSLEYGTVPAVTDVAVEAAIDPTVITLRTFTARWQGASIGGEGLLPWRVLLESSSPSSRLAEWMQALPPEPARARMAIRIEDVTPAVLSGVLAPRRLSEIKGNVSATVTVEAERPSLDSIHATAILDRASLTLAGVAFTQTVPTRLKMQDGRVRIEDFRWSAEGNALAASGGINLVTAPAMDLGVTGVLNLRVLGAFVPDLQPAGRAEIDLKVAGSFNDPNIVGGIHVSDGEVQWDNPRFAMTDLEGTVEVATGRTVSVALVGFVNTGTATLDGTIDLGELAKPIGHLQLTGRNVALDYPSGLQTESNADLTITLDPARRMVSGRIDVLGGTYRDPLVLSRQLLDLSSARGIVTNTAPPDWMSGIGLDVAIATTSDVRIDNNYGRLDAGATLRLIGTAAHPGVLGRVEAADEGEIYLGGNTYRVERLTIDLANPRAVTPEVSFSAQTRVGDVPIGIDLHCPASRPCERKVTSLATGVDDKEAEARLLGTVGTTAAAGETLARLLSGEILGVLGRTVGLDVLRLEQTAAHRDIFDDPTLISGDVDPAARLTLAKRVGSNVELVYSQNLADKGFTWSTSYIGPYGLSGRLLILDDQSRVYEFRHEPPLGAARTARRPPPPAPRVTAVTIMGTPGFAEKEIRRQVRLAAGDRFTFGAWQRDRDRIERFYHAHEFLEARIRARRLQVRPADDTVALEYAITRGPTTKLIVRGAVLPDAVRERIVSRWTSALFDGFLEKDARAIVREHFFRLGYLQAAVSAAVATETSRDLKTLTIDVVPGPIVPSRIEVTGNASLPAEELMGAIDQKDALSPWLNPESVKVLLRDHYRSKGYLAADVSVGTPEDVDGSSVVAIHIDEGPPYTIGEVEVSGLPPDIQPGPREASNLSPGARYRPANVSDAVDQLERRLREAAYRQSSVDVDTRVDAKAARVDISLRVTSGPRSILRDVVVDGGSASKPVVARSIVLKTGAPLDAEAIAETRRRLYELDVYRSVDVDVQPLASDAVPSPGAPLEEPVAARISLEERPRYRLRYGLAINDDVVGPDQRDQRLGFAADFENRNVLGSAASVGFSVRLRSDQQVARVTGAAKRFFGLPIRSTIFVEREREQLDPEAAFPTTTDISSVTAQQAYRIRPGMELRYGYGIEHNHTFIRSEDAPFDLKVKVARLTTSALVDRRDDPFNPVRGWFMASTFELSKPGLGSDLSFVKNFAQYSHFVPLGRGMVLASAGRLGLARTFEGEVLIPSERFFAGGANTVRGYLDDDLGARSVLGDAEGGSALLVLNGELRFPVFKWFRGVGFLDAGNVYPRIGDISLSELHVGTGAGVRLDTPFGLFRFDLGVPVNRRPSDPRWRFHFGLGHAF